MINKTRSLRSFVAPAETAALLCVEAPSPVLTLSLCFNPPKPQASRRVEIVIVIVIIIIIVIILVIVLIIET